MARVTFDHLTWSKTRAGTHRYSLADSGIEAPDLEALGLPHSASLPPNGGAVQGELERDFGARVGAPGGRVLLTAATSEANAAVFAALLAPGDEVLVELPGYEPLRKLARMFGATPRDYAREPGARPDALPAAVEAALTPRTRLVVVTDLHNPGGATLERADAEALTALAQKRGFRILADETFRDADTRPLGTWTALDPCWVGTSSLTKAYGLSALRIGWIAGSEETLAACYDALNGLSVNPSLVSMVLAARLFPHLDVLRKRTHKILAANHARWATFVAANPRFAGVATRGTTAWCEFPGADEGDRFAAFASEQFHLGIPRGSYFGRASGLRIGLTTEPARCAAALDVLENAAGAFPWSAAEAREPA